MAKRDSLISMILIHSGKMKKVFKAIKEKDYYLKSRSSWWSYLFW